MSTCFTKITRPDQQKLSQRKRIWKYLLHALQSKLGFLDRSTRRRSSTLAVNHARLRNGRTYHHYHHYRYSYLYDDDHHQQCNGRKMEALKGFDGDGDDDDQDRHGHDLDREKGLNNTPSTCSGNRTVRVQNGVDAEAEKFIDNFYKKLSLERQESTEEFFDMLARGS